MEHRNFELCCGRLEERKKNFVTMFSQAERIPILVDFIKAADVGISAVKNNYFLQETIRNMLDRKGAAFQAQIAHKNTRQ